MNITLDLPFTEFGKIFYWCHGTSDFEKDGLATSSAEVCSALTTIYSKELANIPRGVQVPSFFTEKPGYGNFSVALLQNIKADGRLSGDFVFIQLQKRTEQEMHLRALYENLQNFHISPTKTENVVFSTEKNRFLTILQNIDKSFNFNHDDRLLQEFIEENWKEKHELFHALMAYGNRQFNQAHLTLLSSTVLLNLFSKSVNVFEALVNHDENGSLGLKTYWLKNRNRTISTASQHQVIFSKVNESALRYEYLEGMTNLLIDRFATNNSTSGIRQQVVLVLPNMELLEKVRIFQSAQLRVLPAIGIVTFALDYITTRAQFYICNEPPTGHYLRDPVILTERDLTKYMGLSQSFFNSYEMLTEEQRKDPFIGNLLQKGISAEDALYIQTIITKSNAVNSYTLARVFLANIYKLSSEEQLKTQLLNACLDSTEAKKMVIKLAREYLQDEHRLSIYKIILEDSLKKSSSTPNEIFELYAIIETPYRKSDLIKGIFITTIQNNFSSSLAGVSQENKRIIFHDLLILSKNVFISFRDKSAVETIFSSPEPSLFQAIQGLRNEGLWGKEDFVELGFAILSNPEAWDQSKIAILNDTLNLNSAELTLAGLSYFLEKTNIGNSSSQMSGNEWDKSFDTILQSVMPSFENLWEKLTKGNKNKFRELMLSATQNLRNLLWWVTKLAVIGPEEFLVDYPRMVDLFTPLSFPNYAAGTFEEAAILVKGITKESSPSFSFYQTCSRLGLIGKFEKIITISLQKNLPISTLDIDQLINLFPNSRQLLVSVIDNCDNEIQKNQVLGLSAKSALHWLKMTQKALRDDYIRGNRDLLNEHICQMVHPDVDLIFYLLSEDIFRRNKVFSWTEFTKQISDLYKNQFSITSQESITADYLNLTKMVSPSSREALSHRKALATLIKWRYKINLDIVNEMELRCILLYAFENQKYSIPTIYAKEFLLENFDRIVKQKNMFVDDLIYSLDYFYENQGIHPDILKSLTDEGWRRRKSE